MRSDNALPGSQPIQKRLARSVDTYFDDMYKEFEKDVRGRVASILRSAGSREAIEDCSAETFLNAYSALKRKSPQEILLLEYFRGWLLTIAENVARRWFQTNASSFLLTLPKTRTQLRVFIQSIEQELGENGEYQFVITDMDEHQQPAQAIEQEETVAELKECVDMLPDQYRIAVSLHYFDGLKLEQIADRQQQKLNAVKAHVYRGVGMLADYFMVVHALAEMKEMAQASIESMAASCGKVTRLHFLEHKKLHDIAAHCRFSEEKVKRLLYHGAHIVAAQFATEPETKE